ncbi:hypothetical protein [Paludibacterium paludis]|uniref:hypothetical protein n=1 Tax=Paludibacterium paludis TaxID=1225769 RepID=UPI00167B0C78|nr:hypothetical protein [Paludibacterium paludis]
MKLTLSWAAPGGIIFPCCSADSVNSDGLSLLPYLLMDNGGLGYPHTIPWIDEGIAKVDAVLNGELAEALWDREDWGSRLTEAGVEIYSLHDEDYTELIDLPAFRRALLAWRQFMLSAPDTNIMQILEILDEPPET